MYINEDVLQKAIEKWGNESQLGMAIEEAAEFIVAARKILRVGNERAKDAIIDEIADNFVMQSQMALIFGEDAVQERINYKISRLNFRIEKNSPE